MEQCTHREYLTWQAWLRKEWNRPNRTDNYLMQVSADICSLPAIFGFGKKMYEPESRAIKWIFTTMVSQDSSSPQSLPPQTQGDLATNDFGVWAACVGAKLC